MIKRLLDIEFQKLWASKSSRILIIAYFISLTFLALIAAIKFDLGPVKFHLAEQGIFNFPYIWHLNTFLAAIFKIFLAIVIVSMMSNEYSYKTLKQNLIDGLSKKEFVLSKFFTVLVFSVISTLFVWIVSLILGLIYSDYREFSIIIMDWDYLLAYFFKLVGFFSFCLFLGVLVKRSAFALGFLVIWQIFEGLAYGLMRWKLDESWATAFNRFFPLNSMANLIKEPFSRFDAVRSVASQIGEEYQKDYGVHFWEIMIVSGWIFIFIWGSYRLLKIRDL